MYHSISFIDPTKARQRHLPVNMFESGSIDYQDGTDLPIGGYTRTKKIYCLAGTVVQTNTFTIVNLCPYKDDAGDFTGYCRFEGYGLNEGYRMDVSGKQYTILKSAYYRIVFYARTSEWTDLSLDFLIVALYDRSTFESWHLVPSSRPVFPPPKPKTKYVDIPGGDGSIDLTDSLAGRPAYSNREGSFDFLVLNDFSELGPNSYNWVDIYSSVMKFLHGKLLYAVLDDDPNYYYKGRFHVESWTSEKDFAKIVIGYSVEPYKYKRSSLGFEVEIGGVRSEQADNPKRAHSSGASIHFLAGDIITVVKHTGILLPQNKLRTVYQYESGNYHIVHNFSESGNEFVVAYDGDYACEFEQDDGSEYDSERLMVLKSDIQINAGGIL